MEVRLLLCWGWCNRTLRWRFRTSVGGPPGVPPDRRQVQLCLAMSRKYLFFSALFIGLLSSVFPTISLSGKIQLRQISVTTVGRLCGSTARTTYSIGKPRSMVAITSPGRMAPSIGSTSISQLDKPEHRVARTVNFATTASSGSRTPSPNLPVPPAGR